MSASCLKKWCFVLSALSLLGFLGNYFLLPRRVFAQEVQCDASVSPGEVNPSTSASFTFTVTSQGSSDVAWVKIVSPGSSIFSITGASGWTASTTTTEATFTGGTITNGSSSDFTVTATSGSSQSAEWSVLVSSDGGGSGSVGCLSSPGVTILSEDAITPTISSIGLQLTSTTAVISWTTNVSATTVVDYGTTASYGSNSTDATLGTSHSRTLTGLSASTVYHYRLTSVSASEQTVQTADATFTTNSASSTTTTTTTATTTTSTTTATVTRDSTAPVVSVSTDLEEPYTEAPTITGKASDNSRVSEVDYSTDGGKNWLPADSFIAGKSGTFEFTPVIFEDGNYKIKVRALDSSDNYGYSKVYTLVIDRLPPMIGGSLIAIGPQILEPSDDGVIYTIKGLDQKITLSAVGGPISVAIIATEKDNKSLNKKFDLSKNSDNGLWSTTLNFTDAGVYDLTTDSLDGADNQTKGTLGRVVVLESGKILGEKSEEIKEITLTIYAFDQESRNYILWDGASYGQENPKKVTNGEYSFVLPVGKYYLEAKAAGYMQVKSRIFEVSRALPLVASFSLQDAPQINLGLLRLNLPTFRADVITLNTNFPNVASDAKVNLKEIELPFTSLSLGNTQEESTFLRGRPSLVILTSSWLPTISEQIKIVSELAQENKNFNYLVVLSQETGSKADVFVKRGGYSVPIMADADGEIVTKLKLQALPMNLFMNSKGIIKEAKGGVLNKEEIQSLFSY